jgi:hypothetical protein
MIDPKARMRLFEDNKTKTLVSGMKDAIISAVKSSKTEPDAEILKLVVKHEDDKTSSGMLEKIGKALVLIYKSIPSKINLPKVFPVTGRVEADIRQMPDMRIKNLDDLGRYFQALETRLANLALVISRVPEAKIEFPKMETPKFDTKSIVDAIKTLKPAKGNTDSEAFVDSMYNLQKAVESLASRPAMTTQPVTNVNINPLRGFVHTTAVTVTTSLTKLPNYGVLDNRRAVIVFNNDTSNTLYIGGSDVTSANGTPVLAQTYSPVIDAGIYMLLYGVTSSSTVDARVMEISNDASGGK